MSLKRSSILLAAQDALLGEIFPSMQAIDISWSDQEVVFYIFVDSDCDEEDLESVSCIETELLAHFPDISVRSKIIVNNLCADNRGDVCIFARRK